MRLADKSEDANLTVLVRGSERYYFHWHDKDHAELCRQFGRFASNPDLSFTWYNAAVLAAETRDKVKS